MKAIRSLFFVIFSLVLFLGVVYFYNAYKSYDRMVTVLVHNFGGTWMDQFFLWITFLGSANVSIPLLGLLVLFVGLQKRWRLAAVLMINLFGVRVLNRLLKLYFERQRPELEALAEVASFSFPSGHTMNTTGFFGFLAFLFWHKHGRNHPFLSMFVLGIIGLFIFLVGFSRVYLGVHFFADVIGAFIVGVLWVFISIKLCKWMRAL